MEIAKRLHCIESLLGSIRTPPIADISENLATSCAAPLLDECRFSLLASVEILLGAECQRRDPNSLADSFIAWASAHDINPSVVAFVSRTKQVMDFAPEKDVFMSPRSLETLGRLIDAFGKAKVDDATLRAAVLGTIGEQAGTKFIAHNSSYDPMRLASSSNTSGRSRSAPDYWSRNPLAPGVIDAAVRLNILSEEDRAILLKQDSWGAPVVDAAGLVRDAEMLVNAIRGILPRCGFVASEREAPRFTNPAPAPPPAVGRTELGDEQLRVLLEHTFKGSLESEKPGTLGRIFIFRNPDGTVPERIAVKTVDPSRFKASSSPKPLERFSHEISHWVKYRHNPLILAPFFTAFVHGWPYVAMPYCECTLRDYINGSVHKRSQTEPIALMIQAVAALEYAVGLGLVAHQDLKPENILLQDLLKRFRLSLDYPFKWRPRLADFGLANAYEEMGLPWGSRPYLAPEQYQKDVGANFSKVDVFACGVMLYELLTGKHPIGEVTSEVWPQPGPGKSKKWQRENEWKDWARSPKKLPEDSKLSGLTSTIESALEVDPTRRPALPELKRALLSELKQMDIASYQNLVALLIHFHLNAVYSSALDDDDARYQKEKIESLTKPS